MNATRVGFVLWIAVAAFFSASACARPYTITDQLKLETVGRDSATDPTGRWLVWEQAPPYDELPDYGILRLGAYEGAGYRLMAVDLSAAHPVAAPLFAADPQTSYWLDGFSPDGRYLLFYTATAGAVAMGAYDFELRKVVAFAAAPAIQLRGEHRSVWISAEEFVFSSVPAGVQPAHISLRRYTGEHLWGEWQKAWRGLEPTASEVDSHPQDEDDAYLQGKLLRANARTGALDVIADGLYDDLTSSADGRFLAGLRQLRRVQPTPGAADVDWLLSRSQLYLFDLREGAAGGRVAPDKEVYPVTLAWAPDANRLAFFAWDKGQGVRNGIFYSLQADSGVLTAYPHTGLDLVSERERGFAEKPERAVWVDGKLAVFARALADPRATPRFTYTSEVAFQALEQTKPSWFLLTPRDKPENFTPSLKNISPIPVDADAHSLTVLADGAVWRLAVGRRPRNLTAKAPGVWAHPFAVQFGTAHDPFPPFASFIEEHEGQTRIAMLDLRDGRVSVVSTPRAGTTFLGGSPRYQAAFFRSNTSGATDLLLRDARGKEHTLARLNAYLADVTAGQWHRIKYEAKTHLGSRELESCALLPPDYQPGRRYPLIVEVYPGTGAPCARPAARMSYALGEAVIPWSAQAFAARGYIVVQPNTSSELIRTTDGPLGGMTELVLQSVDALVAQGYVDPERVGLLGVSQGGFSALWLATQTPRFKAVVSANGWSDLYSNYFEGMIYGKFYADEVPYIGNAYSYEIEGGDFGLGVSPYEHPEIYLRNSALFRAGQVSSPLLMVHTDLDHFNLGQYEMMFTALYRLRKEAKFLRYWGEGHGTSSPANIRHSTAAMLAWYDKWLDISRAADGSVLWEGERAGSRDGAPARSVEWFIENDRDIARR